MTPCPGSAQPPTRLSRNATDRGICPHCGRNFAIRSDGKLRDHGRKDQAA